MECFVPSSQPPSAEELTAYVGPKADRYMRRFGKFTRTGATRFEFSWNWSAALVGMGWYLYRKMYGWALLDFVLGVLLGWTLFVPILWGVARAVTADYLYFLHAGRKVREARPLSSAGGEPTSNPAHLSRLAAEGGVNAWVVWAAVAALLFFLAVLLFAFGWLREALPPLRDLWPASPGRWV